MFDVYEFRDYFPRRLGSSNVLNTTDAVADSVQALPNDSLIILGVDYDGSEKKLKLFDGERLKVSTMAISSDGEM